LDERPNLTGGDPAKARWLVIQMVRWTGLAIFIVGLLIYADKIDLPVEAGWVLMAIGLLDALFMPTMLAKRWKSGP
jgi:hypothetical protein